MRLRLRDRVVELRDGAPLVMGIVNASPESFSDGGEVRFLNGIYKGKQGARRLYVDWFQKYFTNGFNGPIRGFLLDHLMLQDIVDVAPDGLCARGRFRCVLQGGCHESMRDPIPNFPQQFWEAGIYENAYVKEDGVWKWDIDIWNPVQ